nr:acylphosphatase-2 isoform X4 [Caretta caretta]
MPQRWGGARSPSSPHRAWAGSFGPGTDSAWHAAAFPRSLSRARCRPGPASRAQEVRAARPGSVGPGHSRSGSEQAGFLACTLPCPPSPRPPAPSSRWTMKCLAGCRVFVSEWKAWLSKVGSPSSRIDRTNFFNEKEISRLDFSGFSTRY